MLSRILKTGLKGSPRSAGARGGNAAELGNSPQWRRGAVLSSTGMRTALISWFDYSSDSWDSDSKSSTQADTHSWSFSLCSSLRTLEAFSKASITAVLRWRRNCETFLALLRSSSNFTGFWGISAGVLQPLFDGGTLLHRKRAADAALVQAAAQYRGTVLTAFQNVADAMHAVEHDAEALAAAKRAEQAAATSLTIAKKTVELGATGYLSLLNAEQAYQQALINLTQARGMRYTDTVALFQALGGGWWHRREAASATVSVAPRDVH